MRDKVYCDMRQTVLAEAMDQIEKLDFPGGIKHEWRAMKHFLGAKAALQTLNLYEELLS